MKIKAAIEKNRPFCATVFSMWGDLLKFGTRYGSLDHVADCIHGAALWVKVGSQEEEELYFLSEMLQDQREVYEVKQEAA